MRHPEPLKQGDLIAILAPASAVKYEYCLGAARAIEEAGYRVRLYPSCGSKDGSYSSPLTQRVDEFESALSDPEVRAILCARGGYGSVHVINQLGPLPEDCRKWIIGYSDISAFHAYALRNGLCALHAPMAKHLTIEQPDFAATRVFWETLQTASQQPLVADTHPFNIEGEGKGMLIGGNLAVLNGLAATEFDELAWPLRRDCVLFIEDISEAIYAVERMLYRLLMQGVLSRVKGLIVGRFTEYRPDANFQSMEAMISTRLREWGLEGKFPVAFNFPVGHVSENMPLLVGSKVELTVDATGVILQ